MRYKATATGRSHGFAHIEAGSIDEAEEKVRALSDLDFEWDPSVQNFAVEKVEMEGGVEGDKPAPVAEPEPVPAPVAEPDDDVPFEEEDEPEDEDEPEPKHTHAHAKPKTKAKGKKKR